MAHWRRLPCHIWYAFLLFAFCFLITDMDQLRQICVVIIWGAVALLVWASGEATSGMSEHQWLTTVMPLYGLLVIVAYGAHRLVNMLFQRLADTNSDD